MVGIYFEMDVIYVHETVEAGTRLVAPDERPRFVNFRRDEIRNQSRVDDMVLPGGAFNLRCIDRSIPSRSPQLEARLDIADPDGQCRWNMDVERKGVRRRRGDLRKPDGIGRGTERRVQVGAGGEPDKLAGGQGKRRGHAGIGGRINNDA